MGEYEGWIPFILRKTSWFDDDFTADMPPLGAGEVREPDTAGFLLPLIPSRISLFEPLDVEVFDRVEDPASLNFASLSEITWN